MPTEGLSKLTRKYLPPGTLWEVYQFYCGWCSAHSVSGQASQPHQLWTKSFCHQLSIVIYFFGMYMCSDVLLNVQSKLGMEHLFGNGTKSGLWYWNFGTRTASRNAMCAKNWKSSCQDKPSCHFVLLCAPCCFVFSIKGLLEDHFVPT